MPSRSRRARQLVRCVHCGRMVSKDTANRGENGWVGGSCLRSELAGSRNESPNTPDQ